MSSSAFTAEHMRELAALKDIHMPSSVTWWPLAPGWFILAYIILLVLGVGFFYGYKRREEGRVRRFALCVLDAHHKEYQSTQNAIKTAAYISELLKRVALAYYPREEVAGLQGEAWLRFLNKTSRNLDFTTVRHLLIELPYEVRSDADIEPLFVLARLWLSQRRGPCLN